MTADQAQLFAVIAQSATVIVAVVVFIYQTIQEKGNRQQRDEELTIERRSNAWVAINNQIQLINESCQDVEISPADAAQKPDEVLIHEFQTNESRVATNVLFFHHLNLLHIVFLNKNFVMESEIEGFRSWSNSVIGGFLKAVPPLRGTLKHVLDGNDLYSDEFIAFLKDMLFTYLKEHPLD